MKCLRKKVQGVLDGTLDTLRPKLGGWNSRRNDGDVRKKKETEVTKSQGTKVPSCDRRRESTDEGLEERPVAKKIKFERRRGSSYKRIRQDESSPPR